MARKGETTRWWRWLERQWRRGDKARVPDLLQTDAVDRRLAAGGRQVFLTGARMIVTFGFLGSRYSLSAEQCERVLSLVADQIRCSSLDACPVEPVSPFRGHPRAAIVLEGRLMQAIETMLDSKRGRRRALLAAASLHDAFATRTDSARQVKSYEHLLSISDSRLPLAETTALCATVAATPREDLRGPPRIRASQKK